MTFETHYDKFLLLLKFWCCFQFNKGENFLLYFSLSAVRICLHWDTSLVLWWGPDLIVLLNSKYRLCHELLLSFFTLISEKQVRYFFQILLRKLARMHLKRVKFQNFPGAGPPDPPSCSGRGMPLPTPTLTQRCRSMWLCRTQVTQNIFRNFFILHSLAWFCEFEVLSMFCCCHCTVIIVISWHIAPSYNGSQLSPLPLPLRPGTCLDIKISCFRYRNSHYKDKMVSWPSFLYNGNIHTWKDYHYNGREPKRLEILWFLVIGGFCLLTMIMFNIIHGGYSLYSALPL